MAGYFRKTGSPVYVKVSMVVQFIASVLMSFDHCLFHQFYFSQYFSNYHTCSFVYYWYFLSIFLTLQSLSAVEISAIGKFFLRFPPSIFQEFTKTT